MRKQSEMCPNTLEPYNNRDTLVLHWVVAVAIDGLLYRDQHFAEHSS